MMKKRSRSIMLVLLDMVVILISFSIAFAIRFEGNILTDAKGYIGVCINSMFFILSIKLISFYFFGLYNSLWIYASIEELIKVINASVVGTVSVIVYMLCTKQNLPRSIYILTLIVDIILIGCTRINYRIIRKLKYRIRWMFTKNKSKRIMIIGASKTGALVIKELKNCEQLNSVPVLLIDDNSNNLGKKINGVPIMGNRKNIKEYAKKYKIDEILIAIQTSDKKYTKKIIEECSKTKCKIKIIPEMNELIDGKINIKRIREVKIEDLLGRDTVQLDLYNVSAYLKDRIVMVTGGGGSIGSELCRQIASFNPAQLIVLDIYENNAYDLQNELKRNFPKLNLEIIIASIRDRKRMEEVFNTYLPNIVFHAAAHKHVPLMETNPQEAVKNNVFGTMNVVECADKYKVKKFVLISTDKAVNSTNVMGATKRMAEMIIQSMNRISNTEFVAVRFGNVLGSNGSVVPLFKRQIEKGGPVTVTHPEVTRFFMTIPEAVQLVLQAGSMAKGGEIFVLDMGEPVKILDLAVNLIRLMGFEPYTDIDIKFSGLRPGEKLYEELLMSEEGLKETVHKQIFIGKPQDIDYLILKKQLLILEKSLESDREELIEKLQYVVPTYKRELVNVI